MAQHQGGGPAASPGGILVIVLAGITGYFLLREGARQTDGFISAPRRSWQEPGHRHV